MEKSYGEEDPSFFPSFLFDPLFFPRFLFPLLPLDISGTATFVFYEAARGSTSIFTILQFLLLLAGGLDIAFQKCIFGLLQDLGRENARRRQRLLPRPPMGSLCRPQRTSSAPCPAGCPYSAPPLSTRSPWRRCKGGSRRQSVSTHHSWVVCSEGTYRNLHGL